ncbi:hypothetical protein GCM10009104_26130 [Marinobacterium maritimum]|uniref:SPOR domain-containing protein n=1 Tax=Marinobacterium maritimum TaxID=500162 RepID=A0ABP3TF19_9GAMM
MSVPSYYHEPGSRLQLSEKLQHLVRFSDFLILIAGVEGCGKTTLLNKLEQDGQASAGRSALVGFEATADVTGLLQALTHALQMEPADGNQARLSQLHALAKQLAEDDLPLVLLIDDADYLTNNALELLINFATLEGAAAPRILLAGTPAFEQRFRELELDQRLEGHLHVEHLEPFTAEESAEFIESLLPDGVVLKERQLRLLVEQSAGRPARLRQAVADVLKRDSGVARSSGKLPMPPKHISAAFIILLLVFSVAIWQYLPDDEAETVVAERVTLPLAINTVPQAQTGAADEIRLDVEPSRPADSSSMPPGVEQAMAALTPAETLVETAADALATTAASADKAASQPEVAPAVVVETAQVGSDIQPSEVSLPDVDPAVIKPAETRPVVVEAAETPVVKRPEPEPVATPAPKPEPLPVAQPKPQPVAKPVAEPKPEPKPVVTQPKETAGAADRWLREQELMGWPVQGYTLQMLGAREEKSVKVFIESQAQPERFYYFRTLFKGKPWHVVVYGQYADRAAAVNAVKALPPALQKLRPWARSIAGVKADIQKNQ